jgi:AmiR/NasT family two-component response regulator
MLHGMTEDDAFDLLRHHSQALNIKLADVARAVIESRGQLPTSSEDPLTE